MNKAATATQTIENSAKNLFDHSHSKAGEQDGAPGHFAADFGPASLPVRRLSKQNTQDVLQIPLSVLFPWILANYYHSGEWLIPALLGQSGPVTATPAQAYSDVARFNPNFGELEQAFTSFLGDSKTKPKTEAQPVNNKNDASQAQGGEVAYQFPLPTLLPYARVAPTSPDPKQAYKPEPFQLTVSKKATGYNYLSSPYFAEAERLIATSATRPVAPELLFGSKLVLAIVLAWCNFPLFAQSGGRSGQWMMLSLARLAKEARLRLVAVKECLAELQRTGLLAVGPATSGLISPEEFARLRYDVALLAAASPGPENNFWSARSIQHKNKVYKLKVQLDKENLPPEKFNPFAERTAEPKPAKSPAAAAPSLGDKSAKAELQNIAVLEPGKDLIARTGELSGPKIGPERPQQPVGKTWERPQLQQETLNPSLRSLPGNYEVFPARSEQSTCINSLIINNNDDDKHEFAHSVFEFEKAIKAGTARLQPTSQPVTPCQTPPNGYQSLPTPLPQAPQTKARPLVPKGEAKAKASVDRLQGFISQLKGEKKVKFEFLTTQARFEGYAREQDGRTTMDAGPAYNFALRSGLSLSRMQELYEQVREVWEQGGIRPGSNPIAYLYWAIQHDKDPRPGGSLDAQLNLQQAQIDRQASYHREHLAGQGEGEREGAFNNGRPHEGAERGTADVGHNGTVSPEPEPPTRPGASFQAAGFSSEGPSSHQSQPAQQNRPGRPYQSYGSNRSSYNNRPRLKPGDKGTDHNEGWD